jgi:hypothetical protein
LRGGRANEGQAPDQQETRMVEEFPRFVVERLVPEMTSADLVDLHAALSEATHRLSADSTEVACLSTIYLPSLDRWIAVFKADAQETVQRAAMIAQLPPGDVHEAIVLIAQRGEAG